MLSQEIKGETVDEDLQNLDPAFLQGMNLHNLVCPPFLFTYSDYFDELEISHNIYYFLLRYVNLKWIPGGLTWVYWPWRTTLLLDSTTTTARTLNLFKSKILTQNVVEIMQWSLSMHVANNTI